MAESNITPAEQRIDLLERRTEQTRAILLALMAGLDNDFPVGEDTVRSTLWAATELLEV